VESQVGEQSTKSYTDTFNEVFPYYLSIGMSYDLFWHGEPYLVKAFREAEEMRVDRMNYEKWLQGLYIYHGIACLQPILNPFSKKKKADEYLKEPIAITERARNQKAINEATDTANFLKAWVETLKDKGIKNGGN
jgi:uncharacterized protein YqcC (DUF446 family)